MKLNPKPTRAANRAAIPITPAAFRSRLMTSTAMKWEKKSKSWEKTSMASTSKKTAMPVRGTEIEDESKHFCLPGMAFTEHRLSG
jgi:hypothetical protein